ncbi:uncharacterized protein LOC108699372 [Xenopus laevis]|uniref:Uncharacterized protein LOC108699372 n=1 Tax=Xenopus laevis TaxID=8355 RepID=A0A8J0TND7_XENLA|nr:uncharacterized protein LOC108699372 [Xenopus laevis]
MITGVNVGSDTSDEPQQCAVFINSSGIIHQCTLNINSPIVVLLDSTKGTPQRIVIMFHRPGNASYKLIGQCKKNCHGNITAVNQNHRFEVINNSTVLNNLGINDSGQYKISVLYQGKTETYYEELNVTFIERPTDTPDLNLNGNNLKHKDTERPTDTPDLSSNGKNLKHKDTGTRTEGTRAVCIGAALVVILCICCVWYKIKKRE